ncbi:hypothetical protein MTX78_21445 [Hymenobacter tibetensis]|uniref:DUF3300 domain-containing protein n=1 Tax=Hymenobacter tibetensis TaxID=497967 RepID=A0ABY4CZR4_9BACT|nr:hypothetical protein [Hymenobacter tibetensis]UOG74670.1 hypothetical protein MTX78_21445 [Hymenobacter tibetensis]
MKLMLKSGLVALLVLLLHASTAQAQVRVNVNVGSPAWGPAVGPDVAYYYIPEIDGYYDLYTQQYVYLDRGYWVSSPYLPSPYAHYDPRFFHPVVIHYAGRQPWNSIRDHRAYCNQRGWQPGRYYGNNGYYGGGRDYGYRTPAPGYRPAPGNYGNAPYNNRPYARSNEYDQRNTRGYYDRRDERSNQNAPNRPDRGVQQGRDGDRQPNYGGGRGPSRGW